MGAEALVQNSASSAAAARRAAAALEELHFDLQAEKASAASERARADSLQEHVWELQGLLRQSQANYEALVRQSQPRPEESLPFLTPCTAARLRLLRGPPARRSAPPAEYGRQRERQRARRCRVGVGRLRRRSRRGAARAGA